MIKRQRLLSIVPAEYTSRFRTKSMNNYWYDDDDD